MKDSHDVEALQRLPPERFADLVREFALARWDGWSVEVAPPTPAGGIDVRLGRGGERRLVHVRHYPPSSRVDSTVVRDLVALRSEGDVDRVSLATTSTVAPDAERTATAAGIDLLDGPALARTIVEAGVEIPPSDAEGFVSGATVPALDEWPDDVVERVAAAVAELDEAAPDDRRVTRTSTYTDVDYYHPAVPGLFAKARITSHSFLAYVRIDGRLRPIVRLSVYQSGGALHGAEEELSTAIRRAL
ncbi:restriction endonuclease [Halomarina halobia]|uniref:Restriction endonuclease n=1 Tax=Halomarina halobia TaxID=3033386 RepID=A0ABD6ACW3_9EURY|nr:restriction endonuclease [Halomarina sp. PSR21]